MVQQRTRLSEFCFLVPRFSNSRMNSELSAVRLLSWGTSSRFQRLFSLLTLSGAFSRDAAVGLESWRSDTELLCSLYTDTSVLIRVSYHVSITSPSTRLTSCLMTVCFFWFLYWLPSVSLLDFSLSTLQPNRCRILQRFLLGKRQSLKTETWSSNKLNQVSSTWFNCFVTHRRFERGTSWNKKTSQAAAPASGEKQFWCNVWCFNGSRWRT